MTREDEWTQMHLAYSEGMYSQEVAAGELAAACLTFRDAEWAYGLYPGCSMGCLRVSDTRTSDDASERRVVWLRPRYTANFQLISGSIVNDREEPLADYGETTLKSVANWIRDVAA